MRQVIMQTPPGRGVEALRAARRLGGVNLALWPVEDGERRLDMVMAWLPNDQVERLLADLQDAPGLRVTLAPRGDLTLEPPAFRPSDRLTSVRRLSPVEVFLSGLQSVGSWRAFLSYSLAAGLVVWIGLYTNTVYLLVAAMLLAPYAGPAMNAAIATARGDGALLGASLARYAAGLAVAVVVSAGLTLAFGLDASTRLMTDVAVVSGATLLLSVVAGAAGAMSLVQSERASLVSGAAVGMLVAASLAPPAGIIGMFGAMGNWREAENGLYLLLNQLAGLNLAGAVVFRGHGLSSRGARYDRGREGLSLAALLLSAALLVGLAGWQFRALPDLQRSDVEQAAEAEVERLLRESDLATLAEKRVRFTGQMVAGRPALLVETFVVRREDSAASGAEAARRLTASIRERLVEKGWRVAPLVRVTMLEAPP